MMAPTCSKCGALGRVGNALLGHPPEPPICLACAKASQHGPIAKSMGVIRDLLDEADRNQRETGPLLYDELRGRR